MEAKWKKLSDEPEVFLCRIPFSEGYPSKTNCYLIQNSGDWLLVDTCCPTDVGDRLLNGMLDDLDVDRSRLSVFLTHMHTDHSGFVDGIRDFDGAVYLSERQWNLSRKPIDPRMEGGPLERFAAIGMTEKEVAEAAEVAHNFDLAPFSKGQPRFVDDGDVIRLGDLELEVLSTSGHTPGHLSLYDPQARILFGGDHVLYTSTPNIEPFWDDSDAIQVYLDNLDKVKRLLPFRLCPGHGEVVDDPSERIDWIARHHQDRFDEVLGILRKSPDPVLGIDAISGISWNLGGLSWDEVSTLQKSIMVRQGIAVLDHLVAEGAAELAVSAEGLDFYTAKER